MHNLSRKRPNLRGALIVALASLVPASASLAKSPLPQSAHAGRALPIHDEFHRGFAAFSPSRGVGELDTREQAAPESPDAVQAVEIAGGASAAHLTSAALVWVPGGVDGGVDGGAATSASLAAVDADTSQVVFYRADTLEMQRAVPVLDWPEQLVALPDGSVLVSCRGARAVQVIRPGSATPDWTLDVDAEPTGLGVSPDGQTLFVAHASAGTLAAFDLRSVRARRMWTLEFGEPLAAVLVHPRGHVVYASPLLGEEIAVVRAEDGDWFDSIPLRVSHPAAAIEPIAGESLADFPQQRALPANAARQVNQKHRMKSRPLFRLAAPAERMRASMARAMVASPGGLRVFVPHAVADQGSSLSEESRFSGGYGGSPSVGPLAGALTTFESESGAVHLPPIPGSADDMHMGNVDTYGEVRLARAAVHHPTRSLLFVASEGTDRVLVLNTRTNVPENWVVGSFATADGPIGLATSPTGDALYVLCAYSRRVERFDLTDKKGAMPWEPSDQAALPATPLDEEMQLGRTLFHSVSEKISITGLTCASCHPDGRQDQRVWSLNLGPRQTPMLAERLHGTAPYNWLGSENSLEDNIANTLQRLNGFGLADNELKALARYIRDGLPAVDNPNRDVGGDLAVAQLHGKQIFEDEDVGCSGCHSADHAFSDPFRYEVGTTSEIEVVLWKLDRELAVRPGEEEIHPAPTLLGSLARITVGSAFSEIPGVPVAYDTPSLHGVFGTAPYFHDGSAETLHDVIARNSDGDHMGATSHLAPEEVDALVAYLETR